MRTKCLIVLFVTILFLGSIASADSYPWPQDLGERTIRIATRWGSVTPFGHRGEFDFYNPCGRVLAHIEDVEKMFNVNVEFVDPFTRQPQDLAARIMAGEQEDYLFSGRKYMPQFVALGLIEPLTEHLDDAYYDRLPPSFRPTTEQVTFMGDTWAFQSKNYTLHPWSVYWNKDMFEREGLPSVYDLYEAGDWTFDTVLDIVQTLYRDTTGDGEIDQYGITSGGTFRWYSLAPMNDAELARQIDGVWKATLNEPQMIEAFEWYADIMEYGGGAFHLGETGLHPTWADQLAAAAFQEMEDDFGIVPLPRGPSADGHTASSAGVHLGYIPAGTPDPRAVIEVVSALWMLTSTYMEQSLDQWEQDLWDQRSLEVRDRESLENWQWLDRNVEPLNFWRIVQDMGIQDVVNRVVAGEGAGTLLSQFNPEFQAYLDDLFQQ